MIILSSSLKCHLSHHHRHPYQHYQYYRFFHYYYLQNIIMNQKDECIINDNDKNIIIRRRRRRRNFGGTLGNGNYHYNNNNTSNYYFDNNSYDNNIMHCQKIIHQQYHSSSLLCTNYFRKNGPLFHNNYNNNNIMYFSTLESNDNNDNNDNNYDHDSNDTNEKYNNSLLSLLSDEESLFIQPSKNNDNENSMETDDERYPSSNQHQHQHQHHQQNSHQYRQKKHTRKKPSAPIPPPTTSISSNSNSISNTMTIPQLQSKQNAQMLFDSIAPHINETTLKQFLDDMDIFAQFMEKEYKNIMINIDEEEHNTNNNTNTNSKKKKNKKKKKKKKHQVMNEIDFIEYKTTIGMIDAFVHKYKDKKLKKKQKEKEKESSDPIDYYSQWNKQTWIKSLLAQFFSNHRTNTTIVNNSDNEDVSKTSTSVPTIQSSMDDGIMILGLTDLWKDSKFTPNVNRINHDKNIEMLMKAREICIESPLLWSQKQRMKRHLHYKKEKKMQDLLLQSNNNMNVHVALKENSDSTGNIIQFEKEAKIIHNGKSDEVLRKEAEEMACLLADRLPADIHQRLMTMFENYINHEDSDFENSPSSSSFDERYKGIVVNESKPRRMRMLFHHLEKNVDFHVHLIAPEVAAFLYVDIPWIRNESLTSNDDDHPLYKKRDGLLDPFNTFENDPRLAEAWKCWLSLRKALVKTFIRSQHAYSKLLEGIQKLEQQQQQQQHDQNKSTSTSSLDTGIRFSNDEHVGAEELLEELDMLRTGANGEKVGRDWADETIERGRSPIKAHLNYQCHLLNDKFGPYGSQETSILADIDKFNEPQDHVICPEIASELPSANRTIFVDNLPIDTDETELHSLYSRCGEIESLSIFNLRPDLDPGELADAELKRRKRKKRMAGSKNEKYSRQRTPIYAMIIFKDEHGFNRATNNMLRIFGMVIRRHAAKSLNARNLYKLHIENIPDGYYAIDIEEKLSKVLHPDMYLSLATGQHINSQAKDLTLEFPSFEVAYHAFNQLKTTDFVSDECTTLNWMPTPKNSMAYWTRQIMPDP